MNGWRAREKEKAPTEIGGGETQSVDWEQEELRDTYSDGRHLRARRLASTINGAGQTDRT
jgi:hypothetical protein